MSRKKEREKEREKNVVATYVYASSQGQRAHSARTKICYLSKVMTTKKFATKKVAISLAFWPQFDQTFGQFVVGPNKVGS